MAAVKERLRRGASDFALKTCHRYLLKSENKPGKSGRRASFLSAGLLLGDVENGGLCGAEDRRTVGGSQDSYTRLTPRIGPVNDVCQRVSDFHSYLGSNNESAVYKKSPVQSMEGSMSGCRSPAKFRRTFCSRSAAGLHSLFGGHGQSMFVRAYSDNGARSEPLYKTKTGYYDILEVTPTATQAQIKTAYYKQSFVYHPDRNAGSEAATVRFSEISEAYTVLGNKSLRKKYDRGLLSQSDLVATARPSGKDTSGGSAKRQTDSRRTVMGTDGRGGVFDFDEFYRNHYSEQLHRQQDIRLRREEMLKKKQEAIEDIKLGRMMEIAVGLMVAMAVAIMMSLKGK